MSVSKRAIVGPDQNERICYGPDCDRTLRRFYGKSRYWKSVPPHFGYKGNNYFCSLQCGMEWAVYKISATSD